MSDDKRRAVALFDRGRLDGLQGLWLLSTNAENPEYLEGYQRGKDQRINNLIAENARLEGIPAVAPDNDPEDTIARIASLRGNPQAIADSIEGMPPFPGYQSRPTVEDQITESDRRDSRDLEIFVLGALAGACWAGLVALAIL